ncbi:hypothetical protein DMTZ50_0316 [Dehalococcoides mccartyi]|uniref:hypothetical protein n=1 Tax=Dehalococcoides mccartyi TaxID=61435 RepID=UPI00006B0573|nr:hypothetical protein [Dehalococcoides mccartyi]MBA2084511.1 hypothetical protein [Dehalococcoides mccartyi]
MKLNKELETENIQSAKEWLEQANQDFSVFQKLVHLHFEFDTNIKCNYPANAVSLLQQTIEKSIKAVAAATGEYNEEETIKTYGHNSAALILDILSKMIIQADFLDLNAIARLNNIDISVKLPELITLKNQVKKGILVSKDNKKVDIRSEVINLSDSQINSVLMMLITIRNYILKIVDVTFESLKKLGINNYKIRIKDQELFLKALSDLIYKEFNQNPLSDKQIKILLDSLSVIEITNSSDNTAKHKNFEIIRKREFTHLFLGVWAIISLVLLGYITFGHESSSRYPSQKSKGIKTSEVGCNDYNENMGIVRRLSQIGYLTDLLLKELSGYIDTVALLFAMEKDNFSNKRS